MTSVVLSANTSWYLYNFRASTIRALAEKGYQVVCLSPEDDYSQKLISDLGCDWQPLEMDNQGNNPIRDAALVLRFFQLYRKIRPVATCHFTIKNNVYGTWAARLLGIPAINNVSGLGTAFIRKGPVAAVVRLLYKTSQPFAYRIFCQNQEDLEQLTRSKLVPPDKAELIPGSGVDLDRFSPQPRPRHCERSEAISPPTHRHCEQSEAISPPTPRHCEQSEAISPPRFLYAGRMLTDKGLIELIQATRQINRDQQHCELWLSGFADVKNVSAVSEQTLQEWAKEPGVKWLGPSDNMQDIYAQVDCVLLPSYREGLPRSLLEAGAMGLPVITTDVPGCRTVVEHGYNGLLCEVKSSDSLAAAMQQMLSMSTEEREQMGANGRRHVAETYDEKLVINATLRAIESAAQQRDGRVNAY